MLGEVIRHVEQSPEFGATFKYQSNGKTYAPDNNDGNENFGDDVEFVFEYVAKNAAAEENYAEFHKAESEQFKAQKYIFDL